MPRKLKLYLVGQVHTSVAGKVDIFYDRNVNAFTATVEGIAVHADSLEVCRERVKAAAPIAATLVWRQIIVIDRPGPYRRWGQGRLDFDAERFEIADALDGRIVQRDFHPGKHDPDPSRAGWVPSDHIQGIYRGGTKSDEHYLVLPYSRRAWAEVLRMRQYLADQDTALAVVLEHADVLFPAGRAVSALRRVRITEALVERLPKESERA